MKDLFQHADAVNELLVRYGVKFGIYKNGTFKEQLFPFDPIPREIGKEEFDFLQKGLIQRVTALNMFLKDIYGEKKIVKDGVIPEEFIFSSSGFMAECDGVMPIKDIFAHISGIDLVQAKDGTWYVLEDNLVWLGRYAERVFTTIKLYFEGYDKMIDRDAQYYSVLCKKLDIPNIYESKEDFFARYPFQEENPDSIYSNLIRAYNNGIVLREEIGSEALAYIQLAIYEMQKASFSEAPLIELQKVTDNLFSFWGAIDDEIENEHIRNLIKCGKRIERLDLYSRLEMPVLLMRRERKRLAHRIRTTGVKYEGASLIRLESLMEKDTINYDKVVMEIEKLAV